MTPEIIRRTDVEYESRKIKHTPFFYLAKTVKIDKKKKCYINTYIKKKVTHKKKRGIIFYPSTVT